MTVLKIIQKSSEFLAKKGIDSPRLQSELIVSHVLNLPRLQLYLNFDKQVSEKDAALIRDLVIQRGKRIPLQYILGYTEFFGINIKIDRRALIPRPETEILVETSLDIIKDIHSPVVLDFGTGSGCISIAIATKRDDTRIVAIDTSKEAIELATENAAGSNTSGRIQFLLSDGFAEIPKDLKFDLIVSNPPYIPSEEIPSLQPEITGHEPVIALDGGKDGLKFYRYLAENAGNFLKEDRFMALELGCGQAGLVSEILTKNKWEVLKIIRDYNKIERVIVAKHLKD